MRVSVARCLCLTHVFYKVTTPWFLNPIPWRIILFSTTIWAKIMSEKISITPFAIVGLIGSTLLALLTLPFAFNQFFSFWVGIYGLMLLLAYPDKQSLQQLIFVPIIPSFLASLLYYWSMEIAFTPSSLIFFSAFALNAWQIQYQKNGFSVSYSTLFHAVWDTFIKLCITAFFVLLCWIILLLCDELFKLIQINFIHTLINKKWFDIFVSGIFSSTGLYIASLSDKVIGNIRAILILICRYLLIPLSIIGIVFIVFSTISAIQKHTLPTNYLTFMAIAFLSALFLNGVYQDGQTNDLYPRFLFWICRVFIWITPLFTALALRSLYFHEFSTTIFPDCLNASVLLTYNIVYAIIAMGWQKPLFKPIEKANVVLSILLIATTLLSTNPLVTKRIPTVQYPIINKLAQ